MHTIHVVTGELVERIEEVMSMTTPRAHKVLSRLGCVKVLVDHIANGGTLLCKANVFTPQNGCMRLSQPNMCRPTRVLPEKLFRWSSW